MPPDWLQTPPGEPELVVKSLVSMEPPESVIVPPARYHDGADRNRPDGAGHVNDARARDVDVAAAVDRHRHRELSQVPPVSLTSAGDGHGAEGRLDRSTRLGHRTGVDGEVPATVSVWADTVTVGGVPAPIASVSVLALALAVLTTG